MTAAEAAAAGEPASVRARVRSLALRRLGGRRTMVVAHLEEAGGTRIRAVWFNQGWRARQLAPGREVVLFGTFRTAPDGVVETVQPDLEAAEGWRPGVVAVYAPLPGIGPRLRRHLVGSALGALGALPLLEQES